MYQIIDLTKTIDYSLDIYKQNNYSDPDFSCVEWSSIEEDGFRVSELTLGTQTGTHIDAPAHFDVNGKCLESLPLEHLIGNYFLLDLSENNNIHQVKILCNNYKHERILFVRSDNSGVSTITSEALDILLDLSPIVWVLDGEIKIAGGGAFDFHRRLAKKGKYLVENLLSESARQVKTGGELIVLPLALVGTSGAPCRAIISFKID